MGNIRLDLRVDLHVDIDTTSSAGQQRKAHEYIRSGEFLAAKIVAAGCRELLLKEAKVCLDVWHEEHGFDFVDDGARDGLDEEGDLIAVTEH